MNLIDPSNIITAADVERITRKIIEDYKLSGEERS